MTPRIDHGALPRLALSVRQPWAWAILHGGKTIENRTRGAIDAGNMTVGPVAIHAATGMRRAEYDWAVAKMAGTGTRVPRPDDLIRGAVIDMVDVTGIVTASDSPWFGGPCGLVLDRPRACDPIPAIGRLGYFAWTAQGAPAPPAPWMRAWDRPSGDARTADLFDAPPAYAAPPPKPFGRRRG